MELKPQLHDATLVSVEADWAEKSSRIVFRTYPDKFLTLQASGLRNLVVPRDEPWGPSVSVNEVREIPGASGVRAVEIEMQSGDTIRSMPPDLPGTDSFSTRPALARPAEALPLGRGKSVGTSE